MGAQRKSALTYEIEHLKDLVAADGAVDADVANASEEGEADVGAEVLLVVQHEFVELVVLLAVKGGGTVGVLDVGDGLTQLVGREAFAHMREVEFADEAPGYGIAVQAGGAATHVVGLEGVAQGVSQVEGLADVLLGGVLGYDTLLGVDRLHDEALQGVEVGGVHVVAHE